MPLKRHFMAISVITALLIAGVSLFRSVLAQRHSPIRMPRIYADSNGNAVAEDLNISVTATAPGAATIERSESSPAARIAFQRISAASGGGWHPSSHRQYLIGVTGIAEIEVSNGRTVRIEHGRIVLVEDVTGRGHLTRVVGDDDSVSAVVKLGDL